jgi:polyhydroxybutyrate depolymerase
MHDRATEVRNHRLRSWPTLAAIMTIPVMLAAACSSGTVQSSSPAPAGTSSTTAPAAAAPGTPGAAAVATGPARPSSGCTTPTTVAVQAGTATDETMDVDGTARTFRRFVPTGLDAHQPAPLVLDLHGLTYHSAQEADITQWEALAAREKVVVLTPQGAGAIPAWASTIAPGNPDTAFLGQLIDDTAAALCIDSSRVYSNGISNGGLESSILACSLVDKVAAVGLVSGIVVPDECVAKRPVPAVVFWGLRDCVLPFYGATGPCLGGDPDRPIPTAPIEGVPSVEQSVAKWAQRDGCDATPSTAALSEHVEKRTWTGCDDSAVEFYVVSNGGHTWPGSKVAMAARDQSPDAPKGVATGEIDATTLIWDFFKRFQSPA